MPEVKAMVSSDLGADLKICKIKEKMVQLSPKLSTLQQLHCCTPFSPSNKPKLTVPLKSDSGHCQVKDRTHVCLETGLCQR